MSKYMKAGGGYELLLFFFHHASDQQLGKYVTSNWSMNWSMTLSSLLEYLRSLVLIAVKDLQKWTGEAVNITFLFYQKRQVCRQKVCIFGNWVLEADCAFINHDVLGFLSLGKLCGQLGTFPGHPGIFINSCQHWPSPLKSWQQHSYSPQTAVWRCGSSVTL